MLTAIRNNQLWNPILIRFPGHKTTLQGIKISRLGKRKIIFKMQFFWDMLVPWRVPIFLGGQDFHQRAPWDQLKWPGSAWHSRHAWRPLPPTAFSSDFCEDDLGGSCRLLGGSSQLKSRRTYGGGIFTYISKKNTIHVGKYTSSMDLMGRWLKTIVIVSPLTGVVPLPKDLNGW